MNEKHIAARDRLQQQIDSRRVSLADASVRRHLTRSPQQACGGARGELATGWEPFGVTVVCVTLMSQRSDTDSVCSTSFGITVVAFFCPDAATSVAGRISLEDAFRDMKVVVG